VACLERELHELSAHFPCPQAHRKMVRTTNVIGQCFREVRCRTRPMSCVNNDASCEWVIYTILVHLNQDWKGKPWQDLHTRT
jgi:transposase-like protein